MTGLIGRKIGMTQFYSAEGNVVPVTVVETGPCIVVQKKEPSKDGYTALQVGFGSKKAQRVNKAEQGHMAKAGKGAFEVLREFRLDDVSGYEVGQEIKAADLFKIGDVIGDLSSRRGKVLGMDTRPAAQAIDARVPLAQMFGYATDVRSMTQGRATYTMQFSHYEPVPAAVAEGIIAKFDGKSDDDV